MGGVLLTNRKPEMAEDDGVARTSHDFVRIDQSLSILAKIKKREGGYLFVFSPSESEDVPDSKKHL
jgi:hypothetical protein